MVFKRVSDSGAVASALKAEHEAIESALERLRQAISAGADTATVTELMDIVLDFCEAHFACEEQEFRECNYPQISEHVQAHSTLYQKFSETRVAPSEGTLDAGYLLNLFHTHVDTFDRPAHVYMLRQRIARGEGDTRSQQIELGHL